MSFKFIIKVAIRYLVAYKNDRLISMIAIFSSLGITLGVAALIIVMAVMNGFHTTLIENIVGLDSDVVLTAKNGKQINNYDEIVQKISNYKHVNFVNPLVKGQALAISNNKVSGVLVRGIDLPNLKYKKQIIDTILYGTKDVFEKNDLMLGYELATMLQVKVNDIIKLIGPYNISTIFGAIPKSKDFIVKAIFKSGFYPYDVGTVVIPLDIASKLFNLDNKVNAIEIYTNNYDLSSQFAKEIEHDLGENFQVTSWQMDNAQFFNALKIEKSTMFIILSLIILIAAFNVISSLFMLIKDKTKEIAILRTIGASRNTILSIFLLNGFLIGIIGTLLGCMLGVIFSHYINEIKLFLEKITGIILFDPTIYSLYYLPTEIIFSDVVQICGVSLILSLLASVLPAYKASYLDPIDIMRNE